MPQPLTPDQFVALIRKSNLLEPDRLDAFLREQAPAGAELPPSGDIAQRLVADGFLTSFQSEQLLQGKWRGFTIGKYKVLERLGSGGMGSVYLCEHLQMHRRMAVKVLPIAKAQDPAALGRFYREARAAGLLDHPNLVRAHDIDQDGELHYLVMDYVDGINLQRLVTKTTGPLPLARACHYIRQTLQGLDHAYRSGLVHRDLKPANILLDRTGTIRILDLGLARFYEDNQDLLTIKYDDQNVLGTADYVSPEQAHDSHDVDIRTDIYSLGATFYFCLTGQTLFPEGKVAQKLIWHQTRQPTSLRTLRPEIPAELEPIVEKMLQKKRDDRYQTPAEVIEALAPWVQTPIPPPAEEEIPQLSLAARAIPPGERSPAYRQFGDLGEIATRTPGRRSAPGLPRPASSQKTKRQASDGGGSSRSQSDPAPVAGSGLFAGADHATPRVLASETLSERSAPPNRPTPIPPPGQPVVAQPASYKRVSRMAVLLVALAIGSSAGVALRLSLIGAGPSCETKEAGNILVVDRSGAEDTFPTILDALRAARPEDRIEVREATWEESLRLDSGGSLGRGVTIEGAAPGGRVVWSVPAGHKEGQSLLHLSAVAGLRLRNFTLDGKEQARHLVTLSGPCPGLALEDLHLQGFRASAVHLTNCTGEEGSPVQLSRLHVAPAREAEAGLLFEAFADQGCRHVRVADCRFEGPSQAGVAVTGPVTEIELSGNHFTRLTDGVFCRRAVPQYPVQLSLSGNVFRDVQRAGLHFEAPPPVEGSRIALSGNHFVRTGALGLTDGFRPEPPDLNVSWVWSVEAAQKCYFRRTFTVINAPTRGVLSITSIGTYTVWLNGHRVGQGTFDPAGRHVQAFDVARYLHKGENVLAVEAEGKAGAALLAELSDNSTGPYSRTFTTDAKWKASTRPEPGWQKQVFNDQGWQPARVVAAYGKGEPGWQDLVWDAVVQEHFKYQASRVFPTPADNERDDRSREGFPSFDAKVVPSERLEAEKR